MSALSQEWFTAGEAALLNLPGIPTTKAKVIAFADRNGWQKAENAGTQWRRRMGRGGGVEYHWLILPPEARILWAAAHSISDGSAHTETQSGAVDDFSELWAWYELQTDRKKSEAKKRIAVLDLLQNLQAGGATKTSALQQVAETYKKSQNAIRGWHGLVLGVAREHWAPHLIPKHVGRTAQSECSDCAWEWLKTVYLRVEPVTFTDCYRDLLTVAKTENWVVPSRATLQRRIKKEISFGQLTLARSGTGAAKKLYPHQKRDKSQLHAMEAVNADGHKIDVFVNWPGGEIIRPMMIVFQDIYSGKILSWRVDRSENLEAVRLACGDMIEEHGIPEHCTLDNTRTFASKRLTGGMSNRFRYKIKADDPSGIMTTLGIKVHWATPFSGQSKPIERAFRDFAHSLALHPKFAGAYVGNSPMAKPENYASRAIPLDDFLSVAAERIAEHNARPGRRSDVCAGTFSFDDRFAESYERSVIRKATEAQRHLWLMAATDLLVKTDGVHFHGNRYWSEALTDLIGKKVTIRFDPDLLHDPLSVYRLDGRFVAKASCIFAEGFYDLAAASEHGRKRRAWIKAQKAMLKAQLSMDLSRAVAMMPTLEQPPPPETKLVRPIFGNTALKSSPAVDDEEKPDKFLDTLQWQYAARRAERGEHLRVVTEEDD